MAADPGASSQASVDRQPHRSGMSCCLDSACSVSRTMNPQATCRLNAALWDRCFVMASILQKLGRAGQFKSPNLYHPKKRTPHQAAQLLAVHHHALMAQRCPEPHREMEMR